MIELVFLASIRERLGCGRLSFDLGQVSMTVAELSGCLALRGDLWRQVLLDDRVLVAVNQQLCQADSIVQAGDEVAYLPPVTGG
ncbi:MAG: molybdopterin synthase sulfur carrier subunit [Motiliproteus sp.]